MYLARFGIPDGPIAQGLVSLPALPVVPAELEDRWWEALTAAVAGLDAVGYGGVSMRAALSPGRQLRRTLIVAAAGAREPQLRRWLATLTRLETLIPGSARLPITRDEYDADADDFPPLRCRVATSGFAAGGAWIACDFRLAPTLGSLMEEADAYGYRLGYAVNVRPLTVAADQIRRAFRNVLAVQDLAGAPPALVAMQRDLAERLRRSSAVCEEYVAVDPGEPEAWLLEALRGRFDRALSALRFDSPNWELVEYGFDDELACPMFSDSPALLEDDLCAAVLTHAEIADMLLWRPPRALAARFAPPYRPQPDVEGELALPAWGLPDPDHDGGPFFFVSYRRTDLDRVAPVIEHVRRQGWRLWYDSEIAGGTEWNAVLEQRLAACSGVLLFLSQPAVDSKFVRRELQFADSLGKPIIGVQLEAAQLRHGLGLLLSQYQLLSHETADFANRLHGALARVAAATAG
jgi:hypothetical protein